MAVCPLVCLSTGTSIFNTLLLANLSLRCLICFHSLNCWFQHHKHWAWTSFNAHQPLEHSLECLTLRRFGQEISLHVLSWAMLNFKLLLLQEISDVEESDAQVPGSQQLITPNQQGSMDNRTKFLVRSRTTDWTTTELDRFGNSESLGLNKLLLDQLLFSLFPHVPVVSDS